MTGKQLAIGAKVKSSDGKSLGEVERFVVDSRDRTVTDFVVDKGIFDRGRMVPIEYVTDFAEDEVHIRITAAEAENLPGFVEHEFVQIPGTVSYGTAMGGTVAIAGGSGWMHYGPGGGAGMGHIGGDSLFEVAPMGEVVTRVVGPTTESDIVISNGTDVYTSDGEKIGKVDDVIFNDDRQITGFIVESGFISHHDRSIPIEWVDGVTHEKVRLNVTRAQIDQAKA